MFTSRTLLMTAAVLSLGFTVSAQAAGVISSTTSNVSVNTPVADVGANTSVNTGVISHNHERHSSTGVDADGSLESYVSERTTDTDADGTVTTRQRNHSRHALNTKANAQADVNADARVYNDTSARNEQMREDMNNNDDVHAGAGVNTRSSFSLND